MYYFQQLLIKIRNKGKNKNKWLIVGKGHLNATSLIDISCKLEWWTMVDAPDT